MIMQPIKRTNTMDLSEKLHIIKKEQALVVAHNDQHIKRNVRLPGIPNKVLAIIGIRRAGKTSFVASQISNLLKNGIEEDQILYINFEDDRLRPFEQSLLSGLIDLFYELHPKNYDRRCYLFFDEIQNIPDWALVIRRMYDTKNAQIMVTGSSAKMLSREIATSMRGRSLSTEMWPFSFDEYLNFYSVPLTLDSPNKQSIDHYRLHLIRYLRVGGFPESLTSPKDNRHFLLQDYVKVVLLRDIIDRHQIHNLNAIEYFTRFMLSNMSGSLSINKFFNDLKSQGYKIGRATLYAYLQHIEDAYLAFTIEIYAESMRKRSVNPKKIYTIDPGLSAAYTLSISDNFGPAFENLVYLDLRRKGCHEINYYLTEKRYEVDFIARTRNGEQRLIQVAWDTSDPKTMEREQRALDAAMAETGIEGEIITPEKYLTRATWLHE